MLSMIGLVTTIGAAVAVAAAAAFCACNISARLSKLERASDSTVRVRWKRTDTCTSMPMRATAGAAGYDLYAAQGESTAIPPHARALVSTGVILELPSGFEGQVRPRSGHAVRYGVTVLNAPGTIDSDYRGEVKVLMVNTSDEPFTVMPGDRIAQLIVARVVNVELHEVDDVSGTARGAAGFGSTGTV